MDKTGTTAIKSKGKNKAKGLLIGGAALFITVGVGYGIYYFLKRKKEAGKSSGVFPSGSKGIGTSAKFSCSSKAYPLNFGTCHPDVGILQQYLKKMFKADLGAFGKNKDGVDGQFGNSTKNAVVKHLKKTVFTPKDIASMKTALKFTPRS